MSSPSIALRQIVANDLGLTKLSADEIAEIRTRGIGNGFTVLNPADGFRQDNWLWFGNCSACGERVSNSLRDGVWTHTQYTHKTIGESGLVMSSTSYPVDYCPTASGKVVEVEITYR
jgi:hypothetical protein